MPEVYLNRLTLTAQFIAWQLLRAIFIVGIFISFTSFISWINSHEAHVFFNHNYIVFVSQPVVKIVK